MSDARVIRLADHRKPLGAVELPSGRVVTVRAITGRAMELVEAMRAGEARDTDVWRLAALLVPEATADEIAELEPSDVAVIAEVACGHFEAMLAAARAEGKSAAPGTETTTPPPAPAPGSDPSPTA